jgi:LPXTG-motif cell wall-anchored protein
MITQIPETGNIQIIAIAAVIGIVILAAVALYLKKRTRQASVQKTREQPERPRSRLDYHPESQVTRKFERSQKAIRKQAIPVSVPKPENDLTTGKTDITQSLSALTSKYRIARITIATKDGLVFASSGSLEATADAALYSERFFHDHLTEIPGLILVGIQFDDEDLVGIVSTNKPIPDHIVQNIASDTKDILNWWI